MFTNKTKHIFMFSLIGLLLTITVGLALWIITNKIIIKPDLDAEKVIIKYLDNNEAIYDGNILLPSSSEIGLTYESEDLVYYYKLKDIGEYQKVELNTKAGPINAGIYQIKVEYQVTDEKTETVSDLTFTINKATIDMSQVQFNNSTVTYDKQNHMISIDGTLPNQIKGVNYYCNDKVFTGAINSGSYIVKAIFEYDTINYNVVNDLTATLKINRKSIEVATMSFQDNDNKLFKYTGSEISAIKDTLIVTDDDNEILANGVDYEVNFSDLVNVGTSHTISITGIGNYTGDLEGSYTIVDTSHILKVEQDQEKINPTTQIEEVVYNKEEQKPSLIIKNEDGTEIDGVNIVYTITYKSNKNAKDLQDCGRYFVYITVSKEGYISATCTAKIMILQKEISIKWSETTSFVYNGTLQAPDAIVEGIIVGDECYVQIDQKTKQINAGINYKAAIEKLTNSNYTYKEEDKYCTFDIRKADLTSYSGTLDLKYTSPYIQGNEVDVVTKSGYELNGVNINGTNEAVTCKITNVDYSRAVFNINNADKMTSYQTIWITFTPQNNNNYNNYIYKTSIDIYAVATIGSTYYGTVEAAIEAAVSGNNIYLIVGRNPVLRSNSTIKSGVTLNLVYENNKFNDNRKYDGTTFADYDEINNLKNTLTISDKIVLTNNGAIKIDGEVGKKNTTYAGQTSGLYTQIKMESKAIINSYSSIYCLGYIKEVSSNNGSKVNINQGTISAPFVIYDYKGGTISSCLNSDGICPFKIYDIPNVQPEIKISYGAQYELLVDLYANKMHINQSGIYAVGSDSQKSLFVITSGYVTIKYHYIDNSYDTSTMDIYVNGNCNTGGLSISILTYTINTANYYCPIPHKFKININSGGVVNINTKLEFMPGTELIVNKGASLNINEKTIFYNDYTESADTKYKYSTYVGSVKAAAKLLINGNCNINAEFSGTIIAGEDDAALYIGKNQCSSIKDGNNNAEKKNSLDLIPDSVPKYATSEGVTLDGGDNAILLAKGKIGANSSSNTQFSAGGYYLSKSGCWITQTSSEKFTVIYHYYDIDGKEVTSSQEYFKFTDDQVLPVISVENRKYYTSSQDSWKYKTESGDYVDYSSITIVKDGRYDLYLIDKPKEYKISYVDVENDATLKSDLFTRDSFASAKIWKPKEELGKTFIGWYYTATWTESDIKIQPGLTGEDNITAIIDAMEDKGITELTLFGKYKETCKVTFVINNDDYTIDPVTIDKGKYITNIDSINSNLNNRDDDELYSKCFVGWYYEDTFVTPFNKDYAIDSDITLYAKWSDKVQLVYSDGVNLYVRPGSSVTLKSTSNSTPSEIVGTEYNIRYTLSKWQINCEGLEENNKELELNTNYDVPNEAGIKYIYFNAIYSETYIYILTITLSDAKLTIDGIEYQSSTNIEYSSTTKNSTFTVNYTATPTSDQSLVVKEDDTEVYGNEGPYTAEYVLRKHAKIEAIGSKSSCLIEGTMITLFDGSKKAVEDIESGDKLFVFNHETGTIDVANVLFNDFEQLDKYLIINLIFSNGIEVGIVGEHGFFDMTLMQYVYIDYSNYSEYIGHEFVNITVVNDVEILSNVTLDDVIITEEYVRVYSPVTEYHLNYIVNDMLSMPGGISGLFNIFEYDIDLKYNSEKMKIDIENYGLFTYDDFKDAVSYEVFCLFPTKYFKVAMAKGLLSEEQLYYYIKRYTPLIE